MIQQILLGLIFLAALVYLGYIVYRSFKPKNGICDKGCGGCNAIDFKKLEQQIKKEHQQHT